MTNAKFLTAINHNWPDYIINPGTWHACATCIPDQDISEDDIEGLQALDEGSFSCQECDSCNSTLGGDRFHAHAIHHEAFGPNAKQPYNVHHIDICVDCLMVPRQRPAPRR